MEKNYSHELVEAVRNWLDDMDFVYTYYPQDGRFQFYYSIEPCGKEYRLDCWIFTSDDILQCYVSIDDDSEENIEIDDSKTAYVAEYLLRANYGIKIANFDFNFERKKISAYASVPCAGIVPTADAISKIIVTPIHMFNWYISGLLGVINENMSPKDAYEMAEELANEADTDELSDDNSAE